MAETESHWCTACDTFFDQCQHGKQLALRRGVEGAAARVIEKSRRVNEPSKLQNSDDEVRNALRIVLDWDLEGLIEARRHYGESWKAEGGFSAYFNVKRKIDRLVQLCSRPMEIIASCAPGAPDIVRERYDIFKHIETDLLNEQEATLDAVRDLRRYLALVEAEMLLRCVPLPLQRDNAAVARRATDRVKPDATGMEHPFGFDASKE